MTNRVVLLAFGGLVALTQSSYGQYPFGCAACGPAGFGGSQFYGPPAQFYGPPAHMFGHPQYFAPPQYLVPAPVGNGDGSGTVPPTTLVFVQGAATNGARSQAAARADADADLVRAIRDLTTSIDRLRESKAVGGAPNSAVIPPTPMTRPRTGPAPQRPVSGSEMSRTAELDRMLAEFERTPVGPRVTDRAADGDRTLTAAGARR